MDTRFVDDVRGMFGDEVADEYRGLLNLTMGDVLFGVPMSKDEIYAGFNQAVCQRLVNIGEDLLNEAIKCAPILTGRLIESGTVRFHNKIVVGTEKKSASPETASFVGQRFRREMPKVGARTMALYVDVGFNVTYAWWLHEEWGGNLGPRSAQKAAAGFPVGSQYIARPLYAKLDTYRDYLRQCYPPLSYELDIDVQWFM